MSDFLESAKNFVNSTVSRTGWEAQKQLRVRGKQGEIDKLVQQRQQLMEELGQVAMTLYQQGNLSDTQLSRLCASIFELDHDLRTRETQLEDLKKEGYPADQFKPGPTMDYSPPTPSTPSGTNAQPSFSTPPSSGTTAGYSGSGASAGASTAAGTVPCVQCGVGLRPNSLYCRNCGAKQR